MLPTSGYLLAMRLRQVTCSDPGWTRRQYLYHEEWRRKRDATNHEHVLAVAEKLPNARRRVARHLTSEGFRRPRGLATAFRLLDLGLFRVGNTQYTEENGSFGLASLCRAHVRREPEGLRFSFAGKGQQQVRLLLDDPPVAAVVAHLLRRCSGQGLLAHHREGLGWHEITTAEINAYVHDAVGAEFTVKDFRTWHATVPCRRAAGR